MATTERNIWKELREPFPAKLIGKIPKGGVQLDYVGHAAVTDRLLSVDPEWSWEPLALDETGLPAVDKDGNFWIKLTIGGVTRLGVGDGNNSKERIGDALRNAAMRFGVALDLWSKQELGESPENDTKDSAEDKTKPSVATKTPPPPPKIADTMTQEQIVDLMDLAKKKGKTAKDAAVAFLDGLAGGPFTKIPASEFDAFRQKVKTDGWKKDEVQE